MAERRRHEPERQPEPERRHEVSVERRFRAPRSLVWALVADTNRWDRASGLSAGKYTWVEERGRRVRRAETRELGFDIEWIEPPYRWIEAEFIEAERIFVKGPALRGGFVVRLDDAPGASGATGTLVRATAYVEPKPGLGASLVGTVQKARFHAALSRFLEAVAEVVEHVSDALGEEISEPAVNRVRRALVAGYDPLTSGPRTPSNPVELDARAAALRRLPADPAVAAHIEALLAARPDEELSQIRPFELAQLWGMERRAVLTGFLHATRVGLVDLRWQINCPVCRVSAHVAERLGEVRNQVHCAACNVDYGVDFAKHVEAVFQPHPAVRPVVSAVYCASSPAFLPHVFAQLRADAGATVAHRGNVPRGALRVRSLYARGAVELDVPDDDGGLEIAIDAQGALSLRVLTERTVRVENDSSDDVVVLIERAGWSAEAVLGSTIATMPEFLDLFATDAPARGVDLAVGHLVVLFTDLTGSTAMYERLGDARAFAIVEEHFRSMDEVVTSRGGATVKTMGDAVMATFTTVDDAVAAAIEMVARATAQHGDHGISVKVGVHAGPCLAVGANGRLDFFGTTVNVAARLQAKASAGGLVLTEALAADPRAAARLAGFSTQTFEAELKGIRAVQRLVAFDLRARP